MRWRTTFIALVLTTTAALAGQPSRAADADRVERVEAAAREFDAGRRSFTARHYEEAADHFENAFRDMPAAAAIRMVIKSHAAARHWSRAATWAAVALQKYPDDRLTKFVAKKILKAVQWQVHKVSVTCSPACSLLVDDKVTPWEQGTDFELYVRPGEHKVEAGWSKGRAKSETITAKRRGKTELSFEAPPLPPPPPPPKKEVKHTPPKKVTPHPPKKPESKLSPIYFYSAAGISTVMVGVTTWSFLDMKANPGKEKVIEDCAGKDTSCPTYQDAIAAQTRSNVLLVSTGVLAAGTAVLGIWFTDWNTSDKPDERSSEDDDAKLSIHPFVTLDPTGHLNVSVHGAF